MRKFLFFSLLTIVPIKSFAQGVSHTNIVLVNSGLNARVVPSAVITVCAANNTNIPCTPPLASTLFKDYLLSVPIANPFNADANGNYAFMAAPGNYTVSITGVGITGYSYQISLIGPSVGTANTWTALQTFSAGLNSAGPNILSGGVTLNGIVSFGGVNASPTSPGTTQLGTNSQPFTQLIIGPAANQSTILITAATLNRTVTFPDASGTVPLLSLASTWSATQTFTGVMFGGTSAALTGTGACATFSGQLGGALAGIATCTGATAASTLTITPGVSAPHGWVCNVQDETTRANLFQQTFTNVFSCTLTATSVTMNDSFVFVAFGF